LTDIRTQHTSEKDFFNIGGGNSSTFDGRYLLNNVGGEELTFDGVDTEVDCCKEGK